MALSTNRQGQLLWAAIAGFLCLGLIVLGVGFWFSTNRPATSGVGRAPQVPLTHEQIDLRVEQCASRLRASFEAFEHSDILTPLTADRLAERSAQIVVETLAGSAEAYGQLMEGWGGVLRDTPHTQPERISEFWARDNGLYPFLEYDLVKVTVRKPTVRPGGTIIVRMDSSKIHATQYSAWDFPDVGFVTDPENQMRIVTINVVSRNGNEAEIDYWWQWSELEQHWVPRQVRFITNKANHVPTMVF